MAPRNFENEYNAMVDALNQFSEMFSALDEYRKTGDKRHLFKTKNYERTGRHLMNEILKMQQQAEKTEAA